MRPSTWVRLILALTAVTLALQAGCARDVDPFAAVDHDKNTGPISRLTFGPLNDRSPTWSNGGDSIFYTAEGGGHLPSDRGVPVGLPVEGGPALPVLRNAQIEGDGIESWLSVPAVSPDGERLAFVEIVSLWDPHPCDLGLTFLTCNPELNEDAVRRPELREIAVHVRRFDSSDPLTSDEMLHLFVPGVTIQTVVGPPPNFAPVEESTVNNYPFHQLFTDEAAFVFRPSWAPFGDLLVFSDGLNLRIWEVGSDSSRIIPRTEDGSWPAWGPDGQVIAFTRIERADSTAASCDYVGGFGPLCRQIRTDYVPGARRLAVIRIDGTGLVDIGVGDEPAWSPDATSLYFRRLGQIWRSAVDGSGAVPVPDTEGGREPAVSPDGRFLAFARLSTRGDYDIWVTELQP